LEKGEHLELVLLHHYPPKITIKVQSFKNMKKLDDKIGSPNINAGYADVETVRNVNVVRRRVYMLCKTKIEKQHNAMERHSKMLRWF